MAKVIVDISMSLDGFSAGPDDGPGKGLDDELLAKAPSFTFVTGIEEALERARAVAGDKHVSIGGGANVIQQYLAAGLVDELQVHLAPVLLGAGVRLFENIGRPGLNEPGCSSRRIRPTCGSA